MFDADEVNILNNEEYHYNLWKKETISRILNITNQNRKEAEWHKLFPVYEPLATNEVY